MTTGIILAGGRGSRMGPLAAQISKALVSVGQQPHVVHQLELMSRSNIDRVMVVTSPDTDVQVNTVLTRAGFPMGRGVITCMQLTPQGPVDAIRLALEHVPLNEPVVVLMSDTYLDQLLPHERDWIGTAPATSDRSFCWFDQESYEYVDAPAHVGDDVTVGAYCFTAPSVLYTLAGAAVRAGREQGDMEVGMAPLLTAYVNRVPVADLECDTWQDLGDVQALAHARRTKFISREQHQLALNDWGMMTKRGSGDAFERQADWMVSVSASKPALATLVPRVFSRFEGQYTMEHVDLPTLAELWLYWPGRPDTWAGIVGDVIGQVNRLWGIQSVEPYTPQEEFTLYANRAMQRVTEYDAKNSTQWSIRARGLLREARQLFTDVELGVFPHGDLNWNNILFSLNTGSVKLIDPRGDDRLPLSYEIAKMRYSYHGGFAAITHKLFAPMSGELMPQREAESAAIDRMLVQRFNISLEKITACEAMLLLAGSAMHPTDEAEIMLMRGTELLEQVAS